MEAGEAPEIDPGLERWRQRGDQKNIKQNDINTKIEFDGGKSSHSGVSPAQQDQKEISRGRNQEELEENRRSFGEDVLQKSILENEPVVTCAKVVVVGDDGQGLDSLLLGYVSEDDIQIKEKSVVEVLEKDGPGGEGVFSSKTDAQGGEPTAVSAEHRGNKVEFQLTDARSAPGDSSRRGRGSVERGGGRGRGARGRDRGRGRGRGDGGRHAQQRPPRPQDPSLLEKLLAAEILQDKSYILQSFRFFVVNDFFEGYAKGEPLRFPATVAETAQQAMKLLPVEKPTIQEILGK